MEPAGRGPGPKSGARRLFVCTGRAPVCAVSSSCPRSKMVRDRAVHAALFQLLRGFSYGACVFLRESIISFLSLYRIRSSPPCPRSRSAWTSRCAASRCAAVTAAAAALLALARCATCAGGAALASRLAALRAAENSLARRARALPLTASPPRHLAPPPSAAQNAGAQRPRQVGGNAPRRAVGAVRAVQRQGRHLQPHDRCARARAAALAVSHARAARRSCAARARGRARARQRCTPRPPPPPAPASWVVAPSINLDRRAVQVL